MSDNGDQAHRCKLSFFPETAAGGYSRVDGKIEFYGRINALLEPHMKVLDFGAGRGRSVQEDPVPWRRALQSFKGKCQRVIGADIDDAVLENPGLDEAHLIGADGKLQLEDHSVDLVVSDMTFEHIADPAAVARELDRVIKPGGWLCALTPNRWGYIGLATNLIPNRWHVPLLRHLQPHRKVIDIFPTEYKLNTRRAIKRHFPEDRWRHCMYGHFAEPAYFPPRAFAWALALLSYRMTPSNLAPVWMIFLQKQ